MTAPDAGPDPGAPAADHETLRGLIGAWALDACTPREAAGVERHLAGCPACAEEAVRLRDAAGWLSTDDPLDPAPALRGSVIAWALTRRPATVPVPDYSAAYAAETARLDALLRDLGDLDWQESAELRWHGGAERLSPAEVLCHLAAVDGLLAVALGLPDPTSGSDLVERTERLSAELRHRSPEAIRALWRAQTRALVETAALAEAGAEAAGGDTTGDTEVDYGLFRAPLREAFLDRAFECWIHAVDIAEAVGYPYGPPRGVHLRRLIGVAARALPTALAALRGAGQATAAPGPDEARGHRAVKLVIEGRGESEWLIPLEPDAPPPPPGTPPVATLALDGVEFCFLAAARRDPDRLPCGITGDRATAHDVLHATRLLSRP
ncbi:MDMPI N domain containing protein [Streptacidiphilus sp. PB12-B1b]|uniref:zf-HC2 domain-containing protein n=1 Tax=Streptacidiphilus sp. PB12-B1b TaxID=2705012 RepID=UPI0015FA730B|nr:zf-HC2 domain-containing protein [Streptacidiphilus sp. PB12-B1b]QMU74979.1 MDMPI N domain containing protein [Streptacidiphilus sp. PB12-B1b]